MTSSTMRAVYLTGFGDYDQLCLRDDAPKPEPATGEVLIRVAAAGVNNTEINIRTGWYADDRQDAEDGAKTSDGSNEVVLPRIQGADACGYIEAVGAGVDPARIGQRVIVDPTIRSLSQYFGAHRDGSFAEYTTVPSENACKVESTLSDIELASFPCSYSTAENLLTRSGVKCRETVLITGASGGVGSAAVQLAKMRGATVIAVTVEGKAATLRGLGADRTLSRHASLVRALGVNCVDVVIDLAGGPDWPQLLEVLRSGGRYASSGAVGGPVVSLDLRTFYFKDLTLFGCTAYPPEVFSHLIRHIEGGKIKPLVAQVHSLEHIVDAQKAFLKRQHVGKIVLQVSR
ncbi:MAG: NAD-dependent epimerase/dehydratase family protein [Mesorhizobium sp.]|nr:MAG: NAD-dependent epimerase/dehydratase family protein [Mesorhizobium sp.]